MKDKMNCRHIASSELSEQGFPFCPKCGGVLFYQDQQMLSTLQEGVPEENDKIVTYLYCADCERDYEVIDNEDGGYDFLDKSRY